MPVKCYKMRINLFHRLVMKVVIIRYRISTISSSHWKELVPFNTRNCIGERKGKTDESTWYTFFWIRILRIIVGANWIRPPIIPIHFPIVGTILPFRDAMPRVFSPTGFHIIFPVNKEVWIRIYRILRIIVWGCLKSPSGIKK